MKALQVFLAGLITMMASMSFAAGTGPDFTTLTGAIDLTTVIAAIMAVALVGVSFYLAKGGALTVLSFVRRILH